jgi:hypothetical protein
LSVNFRSVSGKYTLQWSGDFAKSLLSFDALVATQLYSGAMNVYVDTASQSTRFEFNQSDQWRSYSIDVPDDAIAIRWEFNAVYVNTYHQVYIDNVRFFAANSDLDTDQMFDHWEFDNGLDYTVDDSALDLDGDGTRNLLEYGAGSNPLDSQSKPSSLTTSQRWIESFENDPLGPNWRKPLAVTPGWLITDKTSTTGNRSLSFSKKKHQ